MKRAVQSLSSQSSNATVMQRGFSRAPILLGVLAVQAVLVSLSLAKSASNAAPALARASGLYSVYLLDQSGNPYPVETDSYVGGLVFDNDDNCIGTVPDQSEGWIQDSSSDTIGFIDPSSAATQELGV